MSDWVVCPGCGHQNSPSRRSCKRCKRALEGETEGASTAVATPRQSGGGWMWLLWGCLGLVVTFGILAGVSVWLVWQEVQSALRSIPEEDLRNLVREVGTAVVQMETVVVEIATALPTLTAATPGPAH